MLHRSRSILYLSATKCEFKPTIFTMLKQSVTLGDEEARKRKVQKTILERKGPPSFTCAVEIVSKTECRVHHRLDATVDAILAGMKLSEKIKTLCFGFLTSSVTFLFPGKSPLFEIRRIDPEADNSSKRIEPSEDVPLIDVKGKSQKSSFIEVLELNDEAISSPTSSVSAEEPRVLDVKETTYKREHTKIVSDLKDEHYTLKSKKVDPNVSPVRKNYPLSIYTYKVLISLDFPFFLIYGLDCTEFVSYFFTDSRS